MESYPQCVAAWTDIDQKARQSIEKISQKSYLSPLEKMSLYEAQKTLAELAAQKSFSTGQHNSTVEDFYKISDRFFREREKNIAFTGIGYFAMPFSSMNEYCKGWAQIIANQTGQNIYAILLPETFAKKEGKSDLQYGFSLPTEAMLAKQKGGLFDLLDIQKTDPITLLLLASERKSADHMVSFLKRRKNNTFLKKRIEALTHEQTVLPWTNAEKKMLLNIPELAFSLQNALYLSQLYTHNLSPFEAIVYLIKSLRLGVRQALDASENLSGDIASIGILAFFEYWNTLAPEYRKELEGISSRSETLGDIFRILSSTGESEDIERCADFCAHILQDIISSPMIQRDALKKAHQPASRSLMQFLETITYQRLSFKKESAHLFVLDPACVYGVLREPFFSFGPDLIRFFLKNQLIKNFDELMNVLSFFSQKDMHDFLDIVAFSSHEPIEGFSLKNILETPESIGRFLSKISFHHCESLIKEEWFLAHLKSTVKDVRSFCELFNHLNQKKRSLMYPLFCPNILADIHTMNDYNAVASYLDGAKTDELYSGISSRLIREIRNAQDVCSLMLSVRKEKRLHFYKNCFGADLEKDFFIDLVLLVKTPQDFSDMMHWMVLDSKIDFYKKMHPFLCSAGWLRDIDDILLILESLPLSLQESFVDSMCPFILSKIKKMPACQKIWKYFPEKKKHILVDHLKKNIDMIKTSKDFFDLILCLTDYPHFQKDFFVLAKEKMMRSVRNGDDFVHLWMAMKNMKDFSLAPSILEQSSGFIKTAYDLKVILSVVGEHQRSFVFQKIKKNIPYLIHTINDLLCVLKYLTKKEKAEICTLIISFFMNAPMIRWAVCGFFLWPLLLCFSLGVGGMHAMLWGTLGLCVHYTIAWVLYYTRSLSIQEMIDKIQYSATWPEMSPIRLLGTHSASNDPKGHIAYLKSCVSLQAYQADKKEQWYLGYLEGLLKNAHPQKRLDMCPEPLEQAFRI